MHACIACPPGECAVSSTLWSFSANLLVCRRRVESAADKGGVFDTVLLDRAAETGAIGGLSVYIGDSASDLAALTAADVGIVVGGNALLLRICNAAGLRLLPLTAGERDQGRVTVRVRSASGFGVRSGSGWDLCLGAAMHLLHTNKHSFAAGLTALQATSPADSSKQSDLLP